MVFRKIDYIIPLSTQKNRKIRVHPASAKKNSLGRLLVQKAVTCITSLSSSPHTRLQTRRHSSKRNPSCFIASPKRFFSSTSISQGTCPFLLSSPFSRIKILTRSQLNSSRERIAKHLPTAVHPHIPIILLLSSFGRHH